MKVLHDERVQNLAALLKVIKTCQPVLRYGSSPARTERVQEALAEAEARR